MICALTALEEAILARWDAGESIETIVGSGEFAAGMVKTTISRFGGDDAWSWAAEARVASAAHVAAIAATGRCYA